MIQYRIMEHKRLSKRYGDLLVYVAGQLKFRLIRAVSCKGLRVICQTGG